MTRDVSRPKCLASGGAQEKGQAAPSEGSSYSRIHQVTHTLAKKAASMVRTIS